MQISLSKKKVIEVKINDKECIICLDTLAIDNFQLVNKMGLQKALEKMKAGSTNIIYKLICSMVRDKKTGYILGHKYFKDFDEFEILKFLQPSILELLNEDMPKAKSEDEKK